MKALIPQTHDVLLIGGGHAHALVLRMWAMNPLPGVNLIVVNPDPIAAYSGMLPGFVAGHYARDDMEIDLLRLARAAGAQIILGRVIGMDLTRREAHFEGRPPIGFDIASIDIGITTEIPNLGPHAIPAKPLGNFAAKWAEFRAHGGGDIAVIGGGLAGAELALAMAHARPDCPVRLIDKGAGLSGLSNRARAEVEKNLKAADIAFLPHRTPCEITAKHVRFSDGKEAPSRFTLLAAAPRAQDWPEAAGLACECGFITTRPTLQTSDPAIFAVGDCAHMAWAPRPKAGVYAVRQAPILFHNLRASAMGRKLRRYHPQKHYLKLISLGDKRAVAQRGAVSLAAPLLWHWKDRIDRKFMAKLRPAPMQPKLPRQRASGGNDAPLCAGCGAKVGRGVLAETLAALPASPRPDLRSAPGDDAAILEIGGQMQVLTCDHLRAFTHDPALMTRIALTHALGDLWAMGATPQSALAQIILPRMSADLQRRRMSEITKIATEMLAAEGAALIGGHSSLGAEMTIGFTLTGLCDAPITLAGARSGDALVLTKPIGSGTILAAEMAMQAAPRDVAACYAAMAQSQRQASKILRETARAMTDVTGFGLAGHLAGICAASKVGAEIALDQVPVMSGALALAEAGIRSSLWEDNRRGAGPIAAPDSARAALMFDPQTSGGLLAAVPQSEAKRICGAGIGAVQIGRITESQGIRFL